MEKAEFKLLRERERLGVLTPVERKKLKALRQRVAEQTAQAQAERKAEKALELEQQLETDARVSRAKLSRSTSNVCWSDRVKAYRKQHGCTEAQAIIALMA